LPVNAKLAAPPLMVDERVDPLAHGQPSVRVLAGDALLAAELRGQPDAVRQLCQLRVPAHGPRP